MRLYLTSSFVNVDLRVAQRSACGRSLIYGCVDAVISGTPYTLLKFDLERVDSRWRGPAPIEFLVQLWRWTWENRSHYTMGEQSCPGCGATVTAGRQPNHAVGCTVNAMTTKTEARARHLAGG